jgi:hypothetical protein
MSQHQLAYRAFTVVKREGQDDWWGPIGAAFPHQSGDGDECPMPSFMRRESRRSSLHTSVRTQIEFESLRLTS